MGAKRTFEQTNDLGPISNLTWNEIGEGDASELRRSKEDGGSAMEFDSSIPAKKPKPTGHNMSTVYI